MKNIMRDFTYQFCGNIAHAVGTINDSLRKSTKST